LHAARQLRREHGGIGMALSIFRGSDPFGLHRPRQNRTGRLRWSSTCARQPCLRSSLAILVTRIRTAH
jgi:hypothetical protein